MKHLLGRITMLATIAAHSLISTKTHAQVLTPSYLEITAGGQSVATGPDGQDYKQATEQRIGLNLAPFSFSFDQSSTGVGGGGTSASSRTDFSVSGFQGPVIAMRGSGAVASSSPLGTRNPEDFYGATGAASALLYMTYTLSEACYVRVDGFIRNVSGSTSLAFYGQFEYMITRDDAQDANGSIAYNSQDSGRIIPAGGNWTIEFKDRLDATTHRFFGPHADSGSSSYDLSITFVPVAAAIPEPTHYASVFGLVVLLSTIGLRRMRQ